MHAVLHLFSDCLQLSSKALGLRLPLDHELVLPGFGAVVRKAQEVEGLRASLPSGGSFAGGGPPELDQPGLALMERQAELQQPVFEIHEELLPICLELTAEHHIICVPTDDHRSGCPSSSPLVNPEIDDVVKKNIRKDGADPRPLRSARLHRSPLAALKDAGLEPPLNQAKHPGVGDPVRQHPHQPSVVNGIEECAPKTAPGLQNGLRRRSQQFRLAWINGPTTPKQVN